MLSSLTSGFRLSSSATTTASSHNRTHNAPFKACSRSKLVVSSPDHPLSLLLHKSLLPVAASAAILLSSAPAEAGFMSGISGIESVPGPELPSIDFLNRFNEENQKRYAKDDERIRSSPIIKELLERSKQNKEKNKQEIMDKYCLRGAEWGVGDCSTTGMTPQERDDFIAMLKKKVEAPKSS